MQTNQTPKFKPASQNRTLTLRVIISNGQLESTTKLRFDFPMTNEGIAHLWLVRLPRLRNADAFPRQLSRDDFELRLDAVADTRPLEALSFSPSAARQWLRDAFTRHHNAPTELLILGHGQQFTVTITEQF